MKKKIAQLLVLLLIGLTVFLSFYTLSPDPALTKQVPKDEFSVKRAFKHVKKIAQYPHYVGAKHHSEVRNYIVQQLQEMGLSVHTQNGYALNDYGILTNPENIVTQLKGTHPQTDSDLLVLAHYDSDPHSSYGASDDASAVGAILESIRAFLAKDISHKNNIIICFTDAEEIGLLGAQLFARQSPWAKNIGLVLNFEARGTSGPSNTIIETNHGNAALVKAFAKAHPRFPMASSLMYEIYKNMPNDTDATVFRVEKDIPGFFFAFIDGHYNYHTANDLPKNLSKRSLAHQGSYLTALLPYFGNIDLKQLQTSANQVYFNFPLFNLIHYSYQWIYPLLIIGWIGFILLMITGFRKKKISIKGIAWGFLAFMSSLILCGIIGYFGWKLIEQIYPQYGEIQQGFPYNGHAYIAAFVALALFVIFGIYHRFYKKNTTANLMTTPLFLWLLICTALALVFKGASYFIIPVLLGEIALALSIKSDKSWLLIGFILSVPAIFIFAPLIVFVPVALGTRVIFGSLILLVLLFGLLLPIFTQYAWKNWLAGLSLMLGVIFLGKAHLHSTFSAERPKPNSLVYLLNYDQGKATWNTYDHILDDWSRKYIDKTHKNSTPQSIMGSKYGSGFTYSNPAPIKPIPRAKITVKKKVEDTLVTYKISLLPQRDFSRIILYSRYGHKMIGLKANGLKVKLQDRQSKIKTGGLASYTRLISYYPTDKSALKLSFQLPMSVKNPTLRIYIASNNLLDNPWLELPQRQHTMMPKPFVLNDAIITRRTLVLDSLP